MHQPRILQKQLGWPQRVWKRGHPWAGGRGPQRTGEKNKKGFLGGRGLIVLWEGCKRHVRRGVWGGMAGQCSVRAQCLRELGATPGLGKLVTHKPCFKQMSACPSCRDPLSWSPPHWPGPQHLGLSSTLQPPPPQGWAAGESRVGSGGEGEWSSCYPHYKYKKKKKSSASKVKSSQSENISSNSS